jgi:hypothetical protein
MVYLRAGSRAAEMLAGVPNGRDPASILLPTYGTRNIVACTEGYTETLGCQTGRSSSNAARSRRSEQQNGKGQPTRAVKSWRGWLSGASALNFGLPGSTASVDRRAAEATTDHVFPRVWVRSIVGCRKVVKKNSLQNHKMFGCYCRKYLFVVVRWPRCYYPHRRNAPPVRVFLSSLPRN